MSSPQTPRHSRHSSTVDAYSESPEVRRQSNDPALPYRNSFSRQDTLDLSELGSGEAGGRNGMGNLADELADAFSESGDEGEEEDADDDINDTKNASNGDQAAGAGSQDGSLSLPSPHRKNHRRKESAYDGSEYGSESDFDASGLPPGLVSKVDAIESLVRRGTENYGGPTDDVIKRVTDSLRDLGSQSSVEGSASRLVYHRFTSRDGTDL